jgi:hypothetical protein
MNPNEMMSKLVSDHSLVDGNTADYYKSHNTWCVTKRGAHKIADGIGIVMKVTDCDITNVSIAYRGTFTMPSTPNVGKVHEIGSCRWDSGKNTPESTHAPEMAWKRLFVRGVLAWVAPASGIYGEDEMPHHWHNQGNAPGAPQQGAQGTVPAAPSGQTAPPAQATQPAPQNAPQAAPTSNPDGTINHDADPRLAVAQRAEKWFEKAAALPSDWNNEMARFCELTRQDRGSWETLLFNHCGKFEGNQGWWMPTNNYPTFADVVYAVKEFNGVTTSKAPFAVRILLTLRNEVTNKLESEGHAEITVPDQFGVLQRYEITTTVNNGGDIADGGVAQTVEGMKEAQMPDFSDDIPF